MNYCSTHIPTPNHFPTLSFILATLILAASITIIAAGPLPSHAFADENNSETYPSIEISSEGSKAQIANTPYTAQDFSRTNKGTNRPLEGIYRGYTYIQPEPSMTTLVDVGSFVMVHVPQNQIDALGLSLENKNDTDLLKALLSTLDANAAQGNNTIDPHIPWYFTSNEVCSQNHLVFSFNQKVNDRSYTFVIGEDGSDISTNNASEEIYLDHAAFAILGSSNVSILTETQGIPEQLTAFFAKLDFSPLLVSAKTTLCALLIIFILGILAAWWSLRLSPRWQTFMDVLFTIPMVLPPTVCGFLLLLALGSNSPIGRWFDSVGFPLIFSWPATVIAAVVVSFPLMYRSTRGAFESLDPDMLNAARTLGWSESRIFLRLMLPLAWSSIMAGTMLAFARALGEFGATLFLAGNYVGITRTIPIAIYFEWMGGNTDVALFWTAVVIVLSFVVIFTLNSWNKKTTRYRRKEGFR